MAIHAQLISDTHGLGRFERCAVLLHRNASVPWLILVPDTSETEFLMLDSELRAQVLDEAARAGKFIRTYFGATKLNFAALGNVVPQLHLHVIGRHPGDVCWPHPVWGQLRDLKPYATADVTAITSVLSAEFGLKSGLTIV
jgi:diadenosine tetraphosphate (Ap4A) HIT family hydrolase